MFRKLSMLLVVAMTFTGCAAVLATQQPGKKDLSVLKQGTSRNLVVSQLGAPQSSGVVEDQKVEVFSFTQGYKTETKAGRALFHLAADVFTLFLWEIIATPAEIVLDGSEQSYKVIYDEKSRVEKVIVLKGKPLPYVYVEKTGSSAAGNSKIVQLPLQKEEPVKEPEISETVTTPDVPVTPASSPAEVPVLAPTATVVKK